VQVAHHLATGASAVEGAVVSLDAANLETTRHTLLRRPQCAACGDENRDLGRQPVALSSRIKQVTADGRHAAVPPETTFERHRHHLSPVTGAVSGLQALSGGDDLPNVYLAGHNFAFPAHDLGSLRRGLRSSSSGKGASDAQAKTSALCEALERYSGLFQGDEPRFAARYHDIRSAAVNPADCLLFSAAQYESRATWNARDSQFSRVPAPFDPRAPYEWTAAWSLTREAPRHLLAGSCYYGYRWPPGQEPCCFADSNGCAAGNTLEEAILQGFLELVERDAVAQWWYNRLHCRGLDIGSFTHPYFEVVADRFERSGRELWALDLTSDLGIPVVAALSRRKNEPRERILFGFGAHLDHQTALLRAVSELCQCLMRAAAGGADDEGRDFADEDFRRWWAGATLAGHPYLAADPGRPHRRSSELAGAASNDLLDDILWCRGIVESRGMEVIVLDQTRPDIGLSVVRVVVPGLRHFWPRFAPGRLYDGPVASGHLERPLSEAELNPVPMFI
jgi:ribosomal protein S12 methylthiotransferase accessory factor